MAEIAARCYALDERYQGEPYIIEKRQDCQLNYVIRRRIRGDIICYSRSRSLAAFPEDTAGCLDWLVYGGGLCRKAGESRSGRDDRNYEDRCRTLREDLPQGG